MNVAVIQNKLVIDAAVFDDLLTAQEFMALDVWPGADGVVELPDGYGIGDGYDMASGAWTHIVTPDPDAPVPEPDPGDTPSDPTPTTDERLTALEQDVAAIETAIERGLNL